MQGHQCGVQRLTKEVKVLDDVMVGATDAYWMYRNRDSVKEAKGISTKKPIPDTTTDVMAQQHSSPLAKAARRRVLPGSNSKPVRTCATPMKYIIHKGRCMISVNSCTIHSCAISLEPPACRLESETRATAAQSDDFAGSLIKAGSGRKPFAWCPCPADRPYPSSQARF